MAKAQLISVLSKKKKYYRVVPNWSKNARQQIRPFNLNDIVFSLTATRAAQLEKRLTLKEKK